MNLISVNVGGVVVGSFASKEQAMNCIRQLAPGCKPIIKKGYKPGRPVAKKHPSRIRVRQQKPRVGNYERVTFLSAGEFKL